MATAIEKPVVDPAPYRDWIYQASNARFGYIRPKNKNSPFDVSTAYAIVLWLQRSFGVSAALCSDGLISVSGPIPKDINRYGFRGKVNPHQQNYRKPSDDPVSEEILRARPSWPWIIATFGDGFTKLRHQIPLAEYVENISDVEPGWIDDGWLIGLQKLAAIDASKINWLRIRDAYQAYKKSLPGS